MSRLPSAAIVGWLVLVTGGAGAQVVFDAPVTLDGPSTVDVAVADLDGDGFADLVAAGNLFLDIHPGLGSGRFGPVVSIPDARAPVVVEDVDGDGVPDLVHGMLLAHPDLLAWSRGLGGGAFAAPVQLLAATSATHQAAVLRVGDADGDGHADLAVHSQEFLSSFLHVLRGDGAGGFTTALDHTTIVVDEMVFADVDGDGFDDVLHTSEISPAIRWARALGDGGFAPVTTMMNLGFEFGGALELGGDGRVELLFTAGTPPSSQLYAYRFNGNTLSIEHFTTGGQLFGNAAIADATLADLDHDGQDDLAVLWGQHLAAYTLGPDGEMTLVGHANTNFSGTLAAGDLDADGRVDLATGQFFGGPDVLLNHTYFDGEPFEELGGVLPGAGVIPTQLLSGGVGAGESLEVRLVNAAPGVPAWRVVGHERADLPFSGGIMIPTPTVVRGPYLTDVSGRLTVSGNDLFPLLRDVYTQWWMLDPAAPTGVAASNGVLVEAPR